MAIVFTGSLSLGSAAADDAYLPRIGIHDVFRTATLTASSAAAGFPVENVADGLTYDWWRSAGGATEWVQAQLASAQECTYMAVAAHSLAGCTLTPQYHNGTGWVALADPVQPVDNQCLMWVFDGVTSDRWRLLIEGATGAVSVGILYCGYALTVPNGLPMGFAPAGLNARTEYETIRSVAGNTLGANVVSEGVSASFSFQFVPEEWVRQYWYALQADLKRYPCFIAWSDKRGAGDVVFGHADRDPSASYASHDRLNLSLRIDGVVK